MKVYSKKGAFEAPVYEYNSAIVLGQKPEDYMEVLGTFAYTCNSKKKDQRPSSNLGPMLNRGNSTIEHRSRI